MFIINKQNSQLLLTDSIRFIAVVKFCVALKFYKRITSYPGLDYRSKCRLK